MQMNAPYRIEGREYSREALLKRCMEVEQDPSSPPWYRDLFAFIRCFLDEAAGPVSQLTSGTTGVPKEMTLDREAMTNSARRTLEFFRLRPGERVLSCLPVDYIAGKMMAVRALVGGLDLVPAEPSGRPLKGMSGTFSFAAMVPMQLHGSLNAGDDLSVIRTLLVGGGELHPSLAERVAGVAAGLGGSVPRVFESFGMTETYTHVALRRINGTDPDKAFRLMEGVKARQDDRGCLVVEAPGVTFGEVVTNDLVELDAPGRSFRWLGRHDNLISTGGIKVLPEILEARIGSLIGAECLVLPRPDEKLGQRLVLVAEWPGEDAPLEEWHILFRQQLALHEIPKQVITVPGLPRNASFKPDRQAAMKLIFTRD